MPDRRAPDTVRRWVAPFGEAAGARGPAAAAGCAILGWAASGGMALTGEPGGSPLVSPAGLWPLVTDVAAWIEELATFIGSGVHVDPATALFGRAALGGLTRCGLVSAGGSTRLLGCQDGWCAVTLSREQDLASVPAILADAEPGEPWVALAAAASARRKTELVERVQLFGVPSAALPDRVLSGRLPWQLDRIAARLPGRQLTGAVVVDLSSLWAGPLCARILADAGARVIKVESTRRPDGARFGNPAFFDWLHARQESVAVDFTTAVGREQLAALLAAADVVIEASRPRALRQLGVGLDQVAHRPGRVWVSITGYGRGAAEERVAFGDDAAVAGGLVGRTAAGPVFCADAVADPLSGMCAALGVLSSMATGGGHLIDVAMRDVAAAFASAPADDYGGHDALKVGQDWIVRCPHGEERAVMPPPTPVPCGRAAACGADTKQVLASVARGYR
ncbi:MAG: CoA transferase [Actinophytocola sp.]|nr:CoA transferase [Actinophytocola sp.]